MSSLRTAENTWRPNISSAPSSRMAIATPRTVRQSYRPLPAHSCCCDRKRSMISIPAWLGTDGDTATHARHSRTPHRRRHAADARWPRCRQRDWPRHPAWRRALARARASPRRPRLGGGYLPAGRPEPVACGLRVADASHCTRTAGSRKSLIPIPYSTGGRSCWHWSGCASSRASAHSAARSRLSSRRCG